MEDAMGNTKFLALSLTDSQETDRVTQTSKEPTFEVPQNLYHFIQEALLLEKQKKEGRICTDFDSKMDYVMDKIDVVSMVYRGLGVLPSDWNYHPDTASNCVPITRRPLPAKKEPKKLPGNPYMQSVPLNELQEEAWWNFKELDEDAQIPAQKGIRYPNPVQKTPVEKTSGLARFISDFAVDVFNKIYQRYINEGNEKNVSDAKIVHCKYLKYEDFYLFYVTLEAVEQGNLGVYKTRIKCEFYDGAMTLDTFILKDHKPSVNGDKFSPEPTYETATEGATDHEAFYAISGMVPRGNKGGGYDFAHIGGSNRWMLY